MLTSVLIVVPNFCCISALWTAVAVVEWLKVERDNEKGMVLLQADGRDRLLVGISRERSDLSMGRAALYPCYSHLAI